MYVELVAFENNLIHFFLRDIWCFFYVAFIFVLHLVLSFYWPLPFLCPQFTCWQRVNNKRVPEQIFFRLVQYLAVCLFECNEAEDFSPAKTLMNMCFTFYCDSKLPATPSPDTHTRTRLQANMYLQTGMLATLNTKSGSFFWCGFFFFFFCFFLVRWG